MNDADIHNKAACIPIMQAALLLKRIILIRKP